MMAKIFYTDATQRSFVVSWLYRVFHLESLEKLQRLLRAATISASTP